MARMSLLIFPMISLVRAISILAEYSGQSVCSCWPMIEMNARFQNDIYFAVMVPFSNQQR